MDGEWADGLTFWIWHHLKAFTSETLRGDRALPSDKECEQWLQLLLNEHSIVLPADAFRFYAGELETMCAPSDSHG